jgi:hypothetical protein
MKKYRQVPKQLVKQLIVQAVVPQLSREINSARIAEQLCELSSQEKPLGIFLWGLL